MPGVVAAIPEVAHDSWLTMGAEDGSLGSSFSANLLNVDTAAFAAGPSGLGLALVHGALFLTF